MTKEELQQLSDKIAYITINPKGGALKSAQIGLKNVGLEPKLLFYVKPTDRLRKEFKKYKLSFFHEFLIPKLKQINKSKKSVKVNNPDQVNIPIQKTITVSKLNSEETADQIQKSGVKYLINCGAGIFRNKIIRIPNLIILNAHAGQLPDYKNMNVVEWAVCNGDDVVGTIHQIDNGIDTGPVWLEENIDIEGFESMEKVREHAFDQVLRMFGKAIVQNEEGKIVPSHHDPKAGKKWYKMHSYYRNKVSRVLKE